MPEDRENESKFMSMLERMGMVRKIDDDELPDDFPKPVEKKPAQTFAPSAPVKPDRREQSEDKMFEDAFAPAKKPQQPVPGLPDPVVVKTEQRPVKQPLLMDEDYPQPDEPHSPTPQQPEPAPKFDQSFWDAPSDTKELPIEAYTDRYLEIDELYRILSMKTAGTDTIYLVEEYLKSLPAALPDESRRDIIVKIIAASGFSFDGLLKDGVTRVDKLKEYAHQFTDRTEDFVNARNSELEALEKQMLKIRSTIEWRRELHKKQFFTIEAEAQRLRDILAFLSE